MLHAPLGSFIIRAPQKSLIHVDDPLALLDLLEHEVSKFLSEDEATIAVANMVTSSQLRELQVELLF